MYGWVNLQIAGHPDRDQQSCQSRRGDGSHLKFESGKCLLAVLLGGVRD
jgi:hypothetical protein